VALDGCSALPLRSRTGGFKRSMKSGKKLLRSPLGLASGSKALKSEGTYEDIGMMGTQVAGDAALCVA